MRNVAKVLLTLGFGAMVFAMAVPASAGVSVSFAYHSAPADVRVWVDTYEGDYYESDYDVYSSVDEVVLSVRASRNTYATVYVVDTEGYVHVVHPCAPGESAFLYGGRVYEYHLSEMGFHPWQFDRGVAYAYAVTSPVPFSYASYDLGIFGPNWGLRISGDPYVASKRFYTSIVPSSCDAGLVGISYARFYVREYVRYPTYLCAGWHTYQGARTYCRSDCSVYRYYRVHAADPYVVLHPKHRLKKEVNHQTHIRTVRYTELDTRDVRPRTDRKVVRSRSSNVRKVVSEREVRTIAAKRNAKSGVPTKPVLQQPRAHAKHASKLTKQHPGRDPGIVRSSKGDYVRGKKNIVTMRDELRKRATAEKTSSKKSVAANKRKTGKKSAVAVKKEESKRTTSKSKGAR